MKVRQNGSSDIDTRIKYFDHLIVNFCRYASLEIKISSISKNKTHRAIIKYATDHLCKIMNLSIENISTVGIGYASVPSYESLAKVSLEK